MKHDFFELPEEVQEAVDFFRDLEKEIKAAKLLMQEVEQEKKKILDYAMEVKDSGNIQTFSDQDDIKIVQIKFEANGNGKKQEFNTPYLKRLWKDPGERIMLKDYFKLDLVPLKKFKEDDIEELNGSFEKKVVRVVQSGKKFRQKFIIL